MGLGLLTLTDCLVACWWLIINVLILWLALKWSERLFVHEERESRLLHVLTIYMATVVVISVFAGAIGAYSGPYLLMLATGGVVVAWRCLRRSEQIRGSLARPMALLPSPAPPNGMCWRWLWRLVACSVLIHAVFNGICRLPTDFDSLAYHMPLINHWAQEGSLYAPQSANWFLPANNELFGAWITVPFSGDFLIGLNNLPVIALWAVALFQICSSLGLYGAWAHLVTLMSILIHTLFDQACNAGNDVAVAAYFAAAGCYILRYLRSRNRADLMLCGVCVGLLAGVKYFALGYAAVMLGTLLACLWFMHRTRAALALTGQAAVVSLLTGSYWYLRNWIVAGNPLYPMGLGGAEAGLGYPSLWQSTFMGNTNPDVFMLGLDAVWEMAGIWHCLAVLTAPAVALYLIGYPLAGARRVSARSTPHDENSQLSPGGTIQGGTIGARSNHSPAGGDRDLAYAAVYGWLVGSALILALTPFALEDQPGTLNHLLWAYTPVRYGLCFLSMASLALGIVLRDTLGSVQDCWIVTGLLAAASVTVFQAVQRHAVSYHYASPSDAGPVAVAVVVLVLIMICAQHRASLYLRAIAGGGIALCLILSIAWLSLRWHRELGAHFDRHFGVHIFSQLNAESTRERVYVLDNRPYPFFGSRRQHWVANPRFFASDRLINDITASIPPTLVATRSDQGRIVYYYRGALQHLEARQDIFKKIDERMDGWHVFRVQLRER